MSHEKFNETKEYAAVSDPDFTCRLKCYIDKQGLGAQKGYTVKNIGNCFYITDWSLSCPKPSVHDLQLITKEEMDAWSNKQPVEPEYRNVLFNVSLGKLVYFNKENKEIVI